MQFHRLLILFHGVNLLSKHATPTMSLWAWPINVHGTWTGLASRQRSTVEVDIGPWSPRVLRHLEHIESSVW